MPIGLDAETLELRTGLRDLLAISTLQAAWAGKDPSGIAKELADVFSSATSSSISILMESLAGSDYLRVNPIFESRPPGLDDSRSEAMAEIDEAAELGWQAQRDPIMEFLHT